MIGQYESRNYDLGPVGPKRTRLAHRFGSVPLRIPGKGSARQRSHVHAEDYYKILESSQLARLGNITQVFFDGSNPRDTRLSHSRDVAQVAEQIGRELGADLDLLAAIALAHDCGHAPFGHVGEALVRRHIKGFHHAVWGADVQLRSLDLSVEVTDGIRNHTWSRPRPTTMEGDIVSWADRIAYLTRDYQIGAEIGLLDTRSLPAAVGQRCGFELRNQREAFIEAAISGSKRAGIVAMDEGAAHALAEFRQWSFYNLYRHRSVQSQSIFLAAALARAIRLMELAAPSEAADKQFMELNDLEVLSFIGRDADSYGIHSFMRNDARGRKTSPKSPQSASSGGNADQVKDA